MNENKINNPLEQIPNIDSRRMQPLPWGLVPCGDGECISVESSASAKHICSFWGGDLRHPKDLSWPTGAQMDLHAKYALHACNAFPVIQRELERIYYMEDMPEEAVKAIEVLMGKFYYEGVPPYAKG